MTGSVQHLPKWIDPDETGIEHLFIEGRVEGSGDRARVARQVGADVLALLHTFGYHEAFVREFSRRVADSQFYSLAFMVSAVSMARLHFRICSL